MKNVFLKRRQFFLMSDKIFDFFFRVSNYEEESLAKCSTEWTNNEALAKQANKQKEKKNRLDGGIQTKSKSGNGK